MVFWGWSALKRRNPRRRLLSHFFSHAAWCLAAFSDFVFWPRRMFAALFQWLSSYFDAWLSFFAFIAGSKNVFFSHIICSTPFTISFFFPALFLSYMRFQNSMHPFYSRCGKQRSHLGNPRLSFVFFHVWFIFILLFSGFTAVFAVEMSEILASDTGGDICDGQFFLSTSPQFCAQNGVFVPHG